MTEAEFKTRVLLLGLLVEVEASVTPSHPPRPYYDVLIMRPPGGYIAAATAYADTAEQARANVDWQRLYDAVCRKLQEEAA